MSGSREYPPSVLTTPLAGIFAIPIFAGKKGLLRRLVVAIPTGIALGVFAYIYDMAAHHVFSHILGAILQHPADSVTWGLVVGIIQFTGALAGGLTAESAVEKLTPMWEALLFLVSAPGITIGYTITFEVALMVWHPANPSLYQVVAVAGLLGLYQSAVVIYTVRLLRRGVNTAGCLGSLAILLNAVLFLGLIVLGIVAFAILLGGLFWAFAGIGFGIGVVLGLLQLWADNMDSKTLGYFVAFFIGVTVALELYKYLGLMRG